MHCKHPTIFCVLKDFSPRITSTATFMGLNSQAAAARNDSLPCALPGWSGLRLGSRDQGGTDRTCGRAGPRGEGRGLRLRPPPAVDEGPQCGSLNEHCFLVGCANTDVRWERGQHVPENTGRHLREAAPAGPAHCSAVGSAPRGHVSEQVPVSGPRPGLQGPEG